MSYNLYDAAINLAKDAMTTLEVIVKKSQSSAVGATVPAARLYPDMKPFTFQVHSATQVTLNVISKASGTEALKVEDDLATYDDMLARIAKVREHLEAVDESLVNARAGETVVLDLGAGLPSESVLLWQVAHGYGVPSIFFHVVTAYGIARKEGVDIGKVDYLTPFLGPFISYRP